MRERSYFPENFKEIYKEKCHYCRNKEKTKQTCLEKYGKEFTLQVKEIREKGKLTLLKKYGVENPSQSEEIKKKKEETTFKHYGVKHNSQVEEIKKKKEETCLKHYGVKNPTYIEDHIEKTQKTSLKKYGTLNPFQNEKVKEKYKQTCIKKYGRKNFFSGEDGKEITRQNCLKKYGVDNFARTKDFLLKRISKYFYDNQSFDSKPEICFYIYCKDQGLNIKRTPCYFEYEYKGEIHRYFPDFEIDGKYYEIKGNQFLTKDGKWCDFYNHTLDELFEEKRQCALKNNVIILYENEYQKYIDYINQKYGKDFLKQFKRSIKE